MPLVRLLGSPLVAPPQVSPSRTTRPPPEARSPSRVVGPAPGAGAASAVPNVVLHRRQLGNLRVVAQLLAVERKVVCVHPVGGIRNGRVLAYRPRLEQLRRLRGGNHPREGGIQRRERDISRCGNQGSYFQAGVVVNSLISTGSLSTKTRGNRSKRVAGAGICE
eukprot:924230-Prorocentrum_minimum.AAC.16